MTFLIVDIEATCSVDDSIPPEEQETIEVGALVSTDDQHILRQFSSLVRPVKNPQLTRLCRGLTEIEQRAVDQAPVFRDVWVEFEGWFGLDDPKSWMSWGKFDLDVLRRDCRDAKLDWLLPKHVDLAAAYTRHTGKKHGRRRAMRNLGLKPKGQDHRALDDARDVFELWVHMRGMRWV